MLRSWYRRFIQQSLSSTPRSQRPSRRLSLHCEHLETRCLLAAFAFSTGNPDGRIATITEPPNTHNSNVEFESADDFILPTETQLTQATFTGLLTGGATPINISNVVVEIYQVFPKGSDTVRIPTVPTRVNSPSDVAFTVRDSAASGITFTTNVLNPTFNVTNSVSTAAKIAVSSGGNGAATGQEVQFTVTFTPPLDLPPDHYFFIPQVGLTAAAPAGSDFLWLSAPKPIVAPGTPFTPDLQSWMRDDPPLAPDWLRIGTDIIGGTTFNATFSLTGQTFPVQINSLSQSSAAEGSSSVTLTLNGTNFTSLSTVLFNGLPLATTFVNAQQLQAIIPASLLALEGTANVTVADPDHGLSNAQTFVITENVPSLSATFTQSHNLQNVTLRGQVFDQAFEGHRVRISWGDGTSDIVDLGSSAGGPWSAFHHFRRNGPRRRTIVITAVDDVGTTSAPVTFSLLVHR
jgi:hypothetical protein